VILFAYANGEFNSQEDLGRKDKKASKSFYPKPDSVNLYESGYGKYIWIHSALKTIEY